MQPLHDLVRRPRGLYDDVQFRPLTERTCITPIEPAQAIPAGLRTGEFLQLNPENPKPLGAGHLTVDWGMKWTNWGTSGTSEDFMPAAHGNMWMYAWLPCSSLRQTERASHLVLWNGTARPTERTCERRHSVLLLPTTLSPVMQNGSSSSKELHKLVRLNYLLSCVCCRIEVV
jgi:hypothetical protein